MMLPKKQIEQGADEHSGSDAGRLEASVTGGTEALSILMAEVDEWIQRVGGRYFTPLTNMAMLSEEVGEVARIMARRYGEQVEKESDKTKDLGEELSDVLFVVLCLANQTGTDLQKAWVERMHAKSVRDRDRFAGPDQP